MYNSYEFLNENHISINIFLCFSHLSTLPLGITYTPTSTTVLLKLPRSNGTYVSYKNVTKSILIAEPTIQFVATLPTHCLAKIGSSYDARPFARTATLARTTFVRMPFVRNDFFPMAFVRMPSV
jgi:hypothetical protein